MEQSDDLKILIEETIDCFQKIEFQEIDERFVNDAWASGFSECDYYDPSSELLLPHDDITAINELTDICESWANWTAHINGTHENQDALGLGGGVLPETNNSTEENLFTVLMNSGISLQNVVSFVFVFCSKASKQSSTLHEKEIGLSFARFYFVLLSVPASTAYRIYHPNIFQVAVDCLKLPKEKLSSKRCNSTSLCDTPSKRRRRNTFESDTPSEPDHILDFAELQESQPTISEYDPKECTKINNFISCALFSLVELLGKFSLKRDQDIVEHTIQQLVECSACETVHTNLQFHLCPSDVTKLKGRYGVPFVVSSLAFRGLNVLCEPKHGNEKHNYLKVLKHLAQNILCSNARSNHSVARKYSVIKDNLAAFVAFNMKTSPEKYARSTRTLLQQLCVKVQDKSEVRLRIANCIISILDSFPDKAYSDMLEWFRKLVLNVKVQSRVFGLEIYAQILNQFADANHRSNLPSVLGMIQSLIFRCNDKAASVRTKALTVVSNNLKFILKYLKRASSEESHCDTSIEKNQPSSSLPVEDYRETVDDIVRMLHHRTEDDKVYVRKASLQAMEKVISLDISYLNVINLKAFQKAAEDASVSVRKQILQSLTVILQTYMSIDTVQEIWLETILPLVLDPESTVQEKCLEVLETVIFHHIDSRNDSYAWDIIMHITTSKQNYLQRYLEKSVFMLIRSERLGPNFTSSLKQHIGSSRDPAVWLLLSLIVPHKRVKHPSDMIDYFNHHEDNISVPTMNNILKVISYTAKYAEKEKLKQIQKKLEHQLKTFSCHHQLISRSLEALSSIYVVLSEEGNLCLPSFLCFCEQLMKDCERYLSAIVLEESPKFAVTEHEMVSRLFTLGECSQSAPSSVPKNSFLLLQSIIASHSDCDYTSGSHNLSTLNEINTVKVKAHAFITLGKLCLLNEDFAKKCLPVFIKELVTSEHFVIRCNVIIILVDMCIRYTSLVDPYIPNITFCLRDPSCIIRRQTLTLLTQLLQEDFIKLKGSMFFRMLSSVVDDDPDIKKDAVYILGHQLLRRQPAIFSHHFVESIFHFNNYKLHCTYNQFFESDEEEKLFSLKGDQYRNKRMTLYKFMLHHMKDEERFGLNLKLCQEILNSVVDEIIPLDENSENLVRDCLAVLSCEEIKLSSLTSNSQDEAEDGDAAAVMARANKNFLSQVVKRNLIENIVPIIIALKRIFSEKKSPLLKDLIAFFRELGKDYKNEIKELMAGEKQIVKEIECDIRRFEKQQEADRNRREQNSSDSESFKICVRNSRTSCERQLVCRQSTLQVIHENSVLSSDVQSVLSSQSHSTTSSSFETPVKRHGNAEASVKSSVSHPSLQEVNHDSLHSSSGLELIPSLYSEQHSASSEVHSLKNPPKNQEASTCKRLSNYDLSASKDLNSDSAYSEIQCTTSLSDSQDPEPSLSENHEETTEVFGEQPVCHLIALDSAGENFSVPSFSSDIQSEVVQPHNLYNNLKEVCRESEMHGRTQKTSSNKSNHCVERDDTATVNKEGNKVSDAENVIDNSSKSPNADSTYNVPSISSGPHSEVLQGDISDLNSQLTNQSPVVVLRKLETSMRTLICSTLTNKQDHSGHKQKGGSGSAREKPRRVLSKFDTVARLKTVVTPNNVQTRASRSGQEFNIGNKTVKHVEHSFNKNISYTMCDDHAAHHDASKKIRSPNKHSGRKKTSSPPKTIIDTLKTPVLCLKKLTPTELGCRNIRLYDQPLTVKCTLKKPFVELQKQPNMECFARDSTNINPERTRSHKIDQFEVLSRKKNCGLSVTTNQLQTPGTSVFFEQANSFICCDKIDGNHSKRTKRPRKVNNMGCSGCSSGSKRNRIPNSFLGKKVNPICSDKLKIVAKTSDEYNSDTDEAYIIHKCLTSCSVVCLTKLDGDVIHNAHYTQTLSTPHTASKTNSEANISCVRTLHKNTPLTNNPSKSANLKKRQTKKKL